MWGKVRLGDLKWGLLWYYEAFNLVCFKEAVCLQLQKLLFSATLSQNPEKLEQLKLFQPMLFTSVVKSESGSESRRAAGNPSQESGIVSVVDTNIDLIIWIWQKRK